MRLSIVGLALAALLFSAGPSSAEEEGQKGMGHGMKRACSNMFLGWLEVPRGIVYENARIPVAGLGLGLVKGAGLTVWRTTYGVIDFLTLGLTGDRLYCDEMPESVFESNWVPRRKDVPTATLPPSDEDTIK